MNIKEFQKYLDKTEEIGFVEQLIHSVCLVSGLPEAHPDEVVLFESGDIGKVLSLSREYVEILLLSSNFIKVGTKAVRTGEFVTIPVGNSLLGRVVDPLGKPMDGGKSIENTEMKLVDVLPPGILARKPIEKELDTGIPIVDIVVPLAKGQRQLIIGDRKTGKTQFLLQTITTQAQKGTICIYCVIGQRQIDVKRLYEYFKSKGLDTKTVILATTSSDPAGLIFLTPYSAMTVAEYFRDKGFDVLLILDDLTSHARYYREVSLLARRFPGRSSYPGDIFYVHARLLERAGNFKKGSITCLPSAESVYGDFSGYIQTNIMSMTDGHIFFDIELYNQGIRPAVSPFLSVTRVGHQSQTALAKDTSTVITSFLVEYEKVKQFLHFGAEVGEGAKNTLQIGEKLMVIFSNGNFSFPLNVTLLILAGIWSDIWKDKNVDEMRNDILQILAFYNQNNVYKKKVDAFIEPHKTFNSLVAFTREQSEIFDTNKI